MPKGAIIAIVEGTKAEEVMEVLGKLPEESLEAVEEVTLDMSESMRKIIRHCFPKTSRVIDRFHVQRLAFDALQKMRIAQRWDAINEEIDAKESTKLDGRNYIPYFLTTETHASNCLPGAGTCFSNPPKNGRNPKRRAQKYFSMNTLT